MNKQVIVVTTMSLVGRDWKSAGKGLLQLSRARAEVRGEKHTYTHTCHKEVMFLRVERKSKRVCLVSVSPCMVLYILCSISECIDRTLCLHPQWRRGGWLERLRNFPPVFLYGLVGPINNLADRTATTRRNPNISFAIALPRL